MSRRSRPPREHFSFDSFLDLVTNVVGIIIRLILVVWVGARSYTNLDSLPPLPSSTPSESEPTLPADPLKDELARQQEALERAQAHLLEQLRQIDLTREEGRKTELDLMAMTSQRETLQKAQADLEKAMAEKGKVFQKTTYTLAEIQKRREKLTAEIKALEKLPPMKKVLRYRTPVSQPVHAEEWHFECRAGRVSFVDISTMLGDVRRAADDKIKQLHDQWQVTDVTDAIGAFRMRYTFERDRDVVQSIFDTTSPSRGGNFRYGLSRWVIEPMTPVRGESSTECMNANAEFRRVVDGLSPDTAVVTFWVYPDGFAIYRQLRDYLADKDITVAGRPLPDDVPITCSRHGSLSRGQ